MYFGGVEKRIAEGDNFGASNFNLKEFIAEAGARLLAPLKERLELVEQAVESAKGMVERKTQELIDKGLPRHIIHAEATREAERIAKERGNLIVRTEATQARFEGGKAVVEESDGDFEWRFPEFDLGELHEECPVCAAIREGASYTTEQAEAEGYPDLPHPNCDHGWVLVPKGDRSKTEAFPPR